MIEIKGNRGKSSLFERLCIYKDTLGIILNEHISVTGDNIFVIDSYDYEEVVRFISTYGEKYRYVVIYSNLSFKEMKPLLEWCNSQKEPEYVVFYRGN
jgi:hypothetical protein